MIVTIFILSVLNVLADLITTFKDDEKSNLLLSSAILVLSGWSMNYILGIITCCFSAFFLIMALIKK